MKISLILLSFDFELYGVSYQYVPVLLAGEFHGYRCCYSVGYPTYKLLTRDLPA